MFVIFFIAIAGSLERPLTPRIKPPVEITSLEHGKIVTLKAPITTSADDIHKIFLHCFLEKIRLDVSSESSSRQRIHLKNLALFSSKDIGKKIKMSSAAIFNWRFKG